MENLNINRRSFIKKTGALAALSSSFLITKNMFAGTSPNEKINVGVIGLGMQVGGNLWGTVSDSRCMLHSICDVDSERLDLWKGQIEKNYADRGIKHEVKTFKDFRKMYKDPELDAVIIVTPDHWHAIMAIQAARHGKHIYCEKPLTFSIQEGEQVVKAVKAAGVVFQTGSQQRSDPSFRNAAQIAQAGLLGEIREIHTQFGWRFPVHYNWKGYETPDSIDWEMWVGPAPMRPWCDELLAKLRTGGNPYDAPWGQWRWHSDYGNGLQADWGAHHYDIAQWALGMDGKGPKYVHVYNMQNPGIPEDKRNIFYEYENGAYVYPSSTPTRALNQAKFDWSYHPGVVIIGTEGITTSQRGVPMWCSNPSLAKMKLPLGVPAVETSFDHRDNWIQGILNGRPTLCPAETGASSCNMCIMGNIAHKVGRDLEWDWKANKFVGDTEANTYLARECRGDWGKYM